MYRRVVINLVVLVYIGLWLCSELNKWRGNEGGRRPTLQLKSSTSVSVDLI